MSNILLQKQLNNRVKSIYKSSDFALKMTRNFREFLFLLSLLKNSYGIWVVLPTNQMLVEFKNFLKESRVSYKHVFIKSAFYKNMNSFKKQMKMFKLFKDKDTQNLNKMISQLDQYKCLPNKGGSIYFSFSNLSCLSKALSFFFKENAFKIFKHDFLSKFNIMTGSLISIKFFDFLLPSNLSFFEFFITSTNFMKINFFHFHFLFIKTTMVVLYSIMLIISLFKVMLMRFMSINLRLFFRFTSYANKKSIG